MIKLANVGGVVEVDDEVEEGFAFAEAMEVEL